VVLKEGNLKKKGSSRHNWKVRWFRLTSATLSYYKSPKISKPQGALILKEAAVATTDRKQWAFFVATPFKILNIWANTKEERDEWMLAIRGAIKVPFAGFHGSEDPENSQWKQELQSSSSSSSGGSAPSSPAIGLGVSGGISVGGGVSTGVSAGATGGATVGTGVSAGVSVGTGHSVGDGAVSVGTGHHIVGVSSGLSASAGTSESIGASGGAGISLGGGAGVGVSLGGSAAVSIDVDVEVEVEAKTGDDPEGPAA